MLWPSNLLVLKLQKCPAVLSVPLLNLTEFTKIMSNLCNALLDFTKTQIMFGWRDSELQHATRCLLLALLAGDQR